MSPIKDDFVEIIEDISPKNDKISPKKGTPFLFETPKNTDNLSITKRKIEEIVSDSGLQNRDRALSNNLISKAEKADKATEKLLALQKINKDTADRIRGFLSDEEEEIPITHTPLLLKNVKSKDHHNSRSKTRKLSRKQNLLKSEF